METLDTMANNVSARQERVKTKEILGGEMKAYSYSMMVIHLRRIYVMLLNFLFGHDWVYSFVGLFSKFVFRKRIKSVFLMYPSQKKYSEAYVYEWYRRQMTWKPRLAGILWQNGRLSLSFIISATDDDVWKDRGDNLKKVYDRMEEIRARLRADQKTFAGIMPGIMFSKKIMEDSEEVKVTVAALLASIDKTKKKLNLPSSTLIIVLGGSGFIGSSLVMALRAFGFPVVSIDLGNTEFFGNIKMESAIIVNVTKRGGLEKYVSLLRPGMVVLNEVYPPPRAKIVEAIKKKGAKIYHVNGLAGGAVPSFPHAYAGGIPCCAGHLPENKKMEVVLTEL